MSVMGIAKYVPIRAIGALDWAMALGRIRKFITVPFGTLIPHKPHTHTHTNACTHTVETLKLQLILILVQIKFLFQVNATNLCQGIVICSVSVSNLLLSGGMGVSCSS